MRIASLGLGCAIAVAPWGAAFADSAADYMQSCTGTGDPLGVEHCQYLQKQWPKDFKAAYRGDYGAQRNVAYCLSGQCGEAVLPKPILGCAWRIVIIGSGSTEVDQSDTMNLDHECGKLSGTERMAAQSQAAQLFRKIYKRDLREP